MTTVAGFSLVGPRVRLDPMTAADAPALLEAAADGALWDLRVTTVPRQDTVDAYVGTALAGAAAGDMIPFVTRVMDGDRVVGSTRFWKIDAKNRKAEIGHTWIARSWQRTFVNTEAKLLMLTHALEAMDLVRVEFQTDALNAASRAAILRIGAVQEGVLRNERIMWDGRIRNSVVFSVIDSEWPQVKAALQRRLADA